MNQTNRIQCSSVATCLIAAFLTAVLASETYAQPGSGPSPVVVGNVIKTNMASQITVMGTLRPYRTVTIGSAVEARVGEVFFEEGDAVGAVAEADERPDSSRFLGQPMLQLLTGTLDIEIRAAEVAVQLSQQRLDELKISLPSDIEIARSSFALAKSRLEYALTNYRRIQQLGSTGVSAVEQDEARSQYDAEREAVNGAKLVLDKLVATEATRLAQAESQVNGDSEQLARLIDMRSKYTIRASFEGIVSKKLTEVGAWLSRGDPVAEVVQLNPIELVVNVPQRYSTKLFESVAQQVSVQFQGIEVPLLGEVLNVVPQMDLRSRSLPVRIRLTNPKNETGGYLLQPGMLGQANMLLGDESEMLLVKKDALVLGGDRVQLYRVAGTKEAPIAESVPVQTGASIGQWIQITKGDIDGNDQIVLVGNERLRPGQAIKIAEFRNETIVQRVEPKKASPKPADSRDAPTGKSDS